MFKKLYFPLISFALIVGAIYVSFDQQLPNYKKDIDAPSEVFSTDRALLQLKEISKKPHFVGTEEHTNVRNYIANELEKMGLIVEIQEQEVINSKWQGACKTFNVLSKIEGIEKNSKSLLLLTHYDSAPHSKSLGASDAGSGVVTMLEGVRAFLAAGNKPKNDIIILFSDAEEIGLLGAKAFVNHHPWAKNVGLVLNFEARGSGGPSYMLAETNTGNSEFIKTYSKAKLSNPVGNSLMYSIYKMLPNDTDLTVFREDADIDGFNFAFIDDHFDYHSEQDSHERLDRNSLKHQGDYLMKLLTFYASSDLTQLKSNTDLVFFNFPFLGTLNYPFSWVLPSVVLLSLVFVGLFLIGLKRQRVSINESLKGFIPMLSSLVAAFVIGFFGWKLMLIIFPEYREILHGFTYNGKWYIMAFTALTIAVFWWIYKPHFEKKTLPNLLFAPIIVWTLINFFIAFKLKGAGFFILPLVGMILSYGILIVFNKISEKTLILFTLIALPSLMILSPLSAMLPVGLGLKMLVGTTVLTVLLMSILISTFDFYINHKPLIKLFLGVAALTFTSAILNSKYSIDQRQPNSIIFFQDTEKNQAFWASYDHETDAFTKQFLTDNPTKGDPTIPFGSKYGSKILLYKNTAIRKLKLPTIIKTSNDSIFNDRTEIDYYIKTNRNSNLFYITSKDSISYYEMSLNGAIVDHKLKKNNALYHTTSKNRKLCSYYLSQGVDSLHLKLVVPKGQKTNLELYDISLDLMESKDFSITPRDSLMMPKPFVINDAVVLKVRM